MKERMPPFLILLLTVIFLASSLPYPAEAIRPFGGPITWYFPGCNQGSLLYVGPPVGGQFMYTGSSKSFLFGPPTHVGQYLLGMSAGYLVCTVPCKIGACPIGGGELILFHGSSQ